MSTDNNAVNQTDDDLLTDEDYANLEKFDDSRSDSCHSDYSRTQTEGNLSFAFEDEERNLEGDKIKKDKKKPPRTICCVPVKKGVTCWNVLSIPLVPIVVMIVSTYLNAQVIFLLRNPEFFDIPGNKIGLVSSSLIFYSLPGSLLATFFAGYLFDIVGRKFTLFTSFIIVSGLLVVVPYTAPNVYPWLLTVRILIGIFTAAPLSNPLVADYIHKNAIGKAASFVALGFVIGEVLSMGVLFTLTANMNPYNAFLTAGSVTGVLSCFFLCLVKEPRLRKKRGTSALAAAAVVGTQMVPASPMAGKRMDFATFDIDEKEEEMTEGDFEKESCCKKVQILSSKLCFACKRNKTLPICFLGSSVTKLYTILFSNFWLLFITSFIKSDENPDGPIANQQAAQKIYQLVMIVSVVVALLFMPLVGKFADSFSPQLTLPVAFSIRAISLGAFVLIKDPGSYYSYAVSTLLVVGTGAEAICVDTLLYRQSDREIRGVIFGTATACGFIGQLAFSGIGGVLYDRVGIYMPFVFVGALDCFMVLFCIVLSIGGCLQNDLKKPSEEKVDEVLLGKDKNEVIKNVSIQS